MGARFMGLQKRRGREPPGVIPPTHKDCRTCLETKPAEDFPKHYGAADGFQNICKTCTRKRRLAREAETRNPQ